MLVLIVRLICSTMMAIVGLIITKKITKSNENILKVSNIALMSCLVILPVVIYDANYMSIYAMINFLMMIVTYKFVLDISFIKAIVSCSIIMVFVYLLDFLSSLVLVMFISADQVRNTWYINIASNTIFSIFLFIIFNIQKLGDWCIKFIDNVEKKRQTKIILFFLLTIIAMSIILYILTTNFELSIILTRTFLIFVIFFLLVIVLFTERNSYDKLSDDYDNLFDCVKVFENWIEKEQFARHEYKNQLAVLHAMSKERKVKEKIDSINDEMINIDKNMIQSLKGLPNGGLKGLLYYKIGVAKGKNINIDVDVSANVEKLFKKLDDDKIRDLSKLIGVYCDNAIEAAIHTRKKIISIEIYNIDKVIHIVISNTFNNNNDISNRYEKGVSTKGEGRGLGLYFANRLLSKSNWIKQKQKIINNLYIQKLLIEP